MSIQTGAHQDVRIAVLVDCDNTSPDILDHALRVVAQFGRVVVRRGYGNHATLANKWQEALVRLAFTPCLQYQYSAGKNTSDIALALDAMEVMFDERADSFCLVTSDSDFAYLCRKLRERGATVRIVGEAKAPDALRNASDQFFEWVKPPVSSAPASTAPSKPAEAKPAEGKPAEARATALPKAEPGGKAEPGRAEAPKPKPKLRPRRVVEAVELLAADSADGKVHLGSLGQYLRRTDPAFSPQVHGHSGLLDMLRTYDLLVLEKEPANFWTVRLAPPHEAAVATVFNDIVRREGDG